MREQIMKHRSAFHTLFRKNSPTVQRGRGATSPRDSTPTFSPYGSFYTCLLLGGGPIMFALAFLILSSCFHGVLLLLFFKTAAAV